MVEIYGVHNATPFGWMLMLKTWRRAREQARTAKPRSGEPPVSPPRLIAPR
jgi:hypothetical protein